MKMIVRIIKIVLNRALDNMISWCCWVKTIKPNYLYLMAVNLTMNDIVETGSDKENDIVETGSDKENGSETEVIVETGSDKENGED